MIFLAVAALQVSGIFTGNELLTSCRSTIEVDKAACFGFITGVVDGYRATHMLAGQEDADCLPDYATYGQFQDTAVAYIEQHPANRHLPAAGLVLLALGQAFDCVVVSPRIEDAFENQ